MQKSIDSVNAVVKADQHYSDQLQHLPDRMQGIVEKSTLSSLDKDQFMEGVRKGFSGLKALAIRQQAMETEKKWESETVGLYEFAIAHAGTIRVKGDHLTIYGTQTLNEFNDRMQRAQQQREGLTKLNEQLDREQQASLQEAGLTKKILDSTTTRSEGLLRVSAVGPGVEFKSGKLDLSRTSRTRSRIS